MARVIPQHLGFVLLAALLLAGCETQPGMRISQPEQREGPTGETDDTTNERVDVDQRVLAEAIVRRKPTSPAPRQRGVAKAYDPRQLVGLDVQAVRELLGPPAVLSEEASGLIWTFRNRACDLHLVMYSSVEGADLRVLQYRIEGIAGDENADAALCVGQMIRDARTQRS